MIGECRTVFSGCRGPARCRGLPREGWSGLPRTVHDRFSRWAKAGVLVRVLETLAERSPDRMFPIGSSINRAHWQAAKGRVGSHPMSFSWAIVTGRQDMAAVAGLAALHPQPGDIVADWERDAPAAPGPDRDPWRARPQPDPTRPDSSALRRSGDLTRALP